MSGYRDVIYLWPNDNEWHAVGLESEGDARYIRQSEPPRIDQPSNPPVAVMCGGMTLEEYQLEYDRLFRWRARWMNLSNKQEPGRLQARQDAIERRAAIANNRIGALIQTYDAQTKSK